MYGITWPSRANDEAKNLSEFGIVKIGQWIPKTAIFDEEGAHFIVLETEEEAALYTLRYGLDNPLAVLTNSSENMGWKEVIQ